MRELNLSELSTILAALRFYQWNGQGDPFKRSDAIHDIATNGDCISLDDEGIDRLCEDLNMMSAQWTTKWRTSNAIR